MPSVRAKFRVASVSEGQVRLEAVVGGSAENESFFKCTPAGNISLGIVNEEASKHFEAGKEFYVDFTSAE